MIENIASQVRFAANPTIIAKVIELTQSDTATFDGIVKHIELDVALSAAIMKQANSAGAGSTHATINGAAISLGAQAIARIILNQATNTLFKGLEFVVNMDDFTRMCFYSAIAAVEIDGKRNMNLYAAGLLRGIGHLAMFQHMPEQVRLCWSEARYNKTPLHEAEELHIGFNHADLSAAILENWNIPKSIYLPIKNCFDDNAALFQAYSLANFKFSLANDLKALPVKISDIDVEYNLAKDILVA